MNTKLRCLLLDDELPGLTYLKMLCEQLPELEVVRSFNDPQVFLAEQKTLDYDLCILDIEMPAMNGLQLASLLGSKLIIFTTAYNEYAADAFDVDAVDYIRKPVKADRLKHAVDRAIKRLEKEKSSKNNIQLNTDKGKAILYFDQLIHLTTAPTDSRDKLAWLEDGSTLVIKNISFEKLLGLLPESKFCRLTKKDVIAIRCVSFFAHDQVTISSPGNAANKRIINLSEAYREDFIKKVRI